MAVWISVKKEKNTPGCRDCWCAWLVCVCVESWHADVDLHKERKEKKIQEKKKLAWVWMMDVCVHAGVLCVDAD